MQHLLIGKNKLATILMWFLISIMFISVSCNRNKIVLDSIKAGDTISPYINIMKINFVEDNKPFPNIDYDIDNDGNSDIKFIYYITGSNNRDDYLGVILLHDDIEIARSVETKNYIVSQLPLYDSIAWAGSYAYNAGNVEWPESFKLNQTIDENHDWVGNTTFYFETSSARDELMAYMDFFSVNENEYIGIRIKKRKGYLYGWLNYPRLWFWGENYDTTIALNIY